LRSIVAVAGGFGLSFVAFGLLWIGTPWHFQALMFVPFLLLAFAVTRTGPGDKVFALCIAGALPLGLLLTLFRDKEGSHLMPILVVLAWLAGILAGHFAARAIRPRVPL
ncbi:MAG: lysophosphatidic acid receptor, partial [Clostridia bacterium]